MRALTLKELATEVPIDLGASDWLTIDQRRIDEFARATNDPQWIHVDAARAAAGPFGTTIAHGYLLLSLVPHLLESMLSITDQQLSVNYGSDRLRFTAPVPVDSRVRLGARITSTAERGGGLLYTVDFELQVRGNERPALVGNVLYLSSA